ncbi:MAG: rRNA maturation RNase YbeY [Lachnospiraceae bacterium]|nr:rRNA maturation RNase YbeY [Lachnospiraceae bacterium]
MTFYVDKEIEVSFPFSEEEILQKVMCEVLESEGCPYEAEVNLLITDAEGIRVYNREYRDIDRETDVLSFPAVDYEQPSDFSLMEEDISCYVNPDTQELMLGDIILNADRVVAQAEEYGHSILREFAFLLTHSMFHLLGYDHMVEEEEKVMFAKQEEILKHLDILR